MAAAWSRFENEAAVAAYLEMLALQEAGRTFNKAARNRQLGQLLPARGRLAIERKHQNISAVVLELGHPYVVGYVPLYNYQSSLVEVVEAQLAGNNALRAVLERQLIQPEVAPQPLDILSILEDPPEPERLRPDRRRLAEGGRFLVKRDYLELESKNAALGRDGERLVVSYEKARLVGEGRQDLAARVEHVSESRGDGAGYDIHSFEVNGDPRLIEAKTTTHGKYVPFFVSRNELEESIRKEKQWHLYRVFEFRKAPRLFIVSGRVDRTCLIDPTYFVARVR